MKAPRTAPSHSLIPCKEKRAGIRDKCSSGEYLLPLAGPMMDLEEVGAGTALEEHRREKEESILESDALEVALDCASPEVETPDRNNTQGLTPLWEDHIDSELDSQIHRGERLPEAAAATFHSRSIIRSRPSRIERSAVGIFPFTGRLGNRMESGAI